MMEENVLTALSTRELKRIIPCVVLINALTIRLSMSTVDVNHVPMDPKLILTSIIVENRQVK